MRHKIFISILFVIVFGTLVLTFFSPRKEISIRENRPLEQFPELGEKDIISRTFQDQWEKAFSDQVVFSEEYKKSYNDFKQKNLTITIETLSIWTQAGAKEEKTQDEVATSDGLVPKDDLVGGHQMPGPIEIKPEEEMAESQAGGPGPIGFEATYLPRGENVFEIKETGNLILFVYEPEEWIPVFESKLDQIKTIADQRAGETDFYLYYIESNRDIDFKNHQITHVYRDLLQEKFQDIGQMDCFSVNQLSDFTDLFYHTDHHLNHIGQAKAYQDIVQLLLGEEQTLPLEIHPSKNLHFVGSRAREIGDFISGDYFYVNLANMPSYDTYVNGEKMRYGDLKSYERDRIFNNNEINHYVQAYGEDKGLVQYDFKDRSKANLLVIADSYSNPINPLIASHFNRTYYVDLRHYENDLGKPFEMVRFIEKNKIDKVLLLGSAGMIISDTFNFEEEE